MKAILKVSATVAVAAVLLVACGSQKVAAEAAVKAAQEAFSQVAAEAQKYVPDQTKAIQDSLTAAQSALSSGDYAAAVQQAGAIPGRISELGSAIAAKKAELTTAWTSMSGNMPGMVAALKSRVDILSQSKRLPTGLTPASVDAAKAGVASASQSWSDAAAAAQAGDMATATAKATAIKAQVIGLMKSLNMQVPAGA